MPSPGSPEGESPRVLTCSPSQVLDRSECVRFLCLVIAVGLAFAPLVAVVRRCAGSFPEVALVVAQLVRTVV